jgi:membrane protein implicated in regulation of membrane protease activity
MSAWVWWFVLGFALLIAELTTGTFYLLVIAVAFAAAGLTSMFGMPFVVQLVVAAGIGLAGSLWLRNSRFGRMGARNSAEPLQSLDVGQVIRIEQWTPSRTARAAYRGAQWDVELAPGEDAAPGDFVIRDVLGNRLIVMRRPAQ